MLSVRDEIDGLNSTSYGDYLQLKDVLSVRDEIDGLNSTSYEDCLQLKDVLSVRDGEERKKEDMGRAGGNTVLSLKRVDTKKHDYLEKTGSALN